METDDILADQVQVGGIEAFRSVRTRHLIVLGAEEGKLPAFAPALGIFTDEERQRLLAMGLSLAPAQEEKLSALDGGVPKDMISFWRLHDGCEIDVPGTVLLSVDEAMQARGSDEKAENGFFPIGYLNFGDWIYMEQSGRVVQIDHEEGGEYLAWPSLVEFLEDSLEWCHEN